MKKFKYLISILLLFFLLSTIVYAKDYTYGDDCTVDCINDSDIIVGTALITGEYVGEYDITSEILMYSSTTITGYSMNDMKMYYYLGDGTFYEILSDSVVTLDSTLPITIVDGVCIDDSCRNGSSAYRTVQFKYKDINGQPHNPTITVKYGEVIPAKDIPDLGYRPGYGFKYWTLEGSNDEFNLETPIMSNIVLEVAWEPITYRVLYDLNGGTTPEATEGLCNLAYIGQNNCMTPSAPTRTGYTFKGWSLTTSNSTTVDLLAAGSSIEPILGAVSDTTITLHAIWEAEVYTINYNLNGGNTSLGALTGTLPATYTYDPDVGITLGTPEREGYDFAGWYSNAAGTGTAITTTKGKYSNPLDLYAKWTPKGFTLKYYVGSGSSATQFGANQSCKYNNCEVKAEIPNGSGFKYWVDSQHGYMYTAGNAVKSFVNTGGSLANINLTAVFSSDGSHTIKYYEGNTELNNNSFVREYITGVGTNLPTMEARTGYIFAGWKDRSSDQIIPKIDASRTDNVVVEAVWTPITKTITYDLNHGTLAGSTTSYTCNLGSTSCVAPSPIRLGYELAGWSLTDSDDDLIPANANYVSIINGATGNLTLHAIWEKIVHRISYDLDGGSFKGTDVNNVPYTASRADNDGVITFVKPVKYGWEFNKWQSSQLTNVSQTSGTLATNLSNTAVVNVKALWNRKELHIVYNKNNGQANQTVNCYYDSCTVSVTNPTNGTETFEYWYDEANGYVFKNGDHIDGFYDIGDLTNDTLTLKAVYSGYQYKNISYNVPAAQLNQDNVIKKYVLGVGANLPTPKKDGYTFAGWSLPGNSNRTFTEIPADATTDYLNLVANWTPNTYRVIYVLDGGTNGSGNPSTFTSDDEEIDIAPPSKTNYSFNGWTIGNNDNGFALEGAGGQNYIVDLNAHRDLVLIANWKNDKYNIVYDLNGGTEPTNPNPTEFVYTSGGWTQTLREPTRVGYDFDGWVVVKGTANLSGNTISINTRNDVYLSARWSERTFDIIYNLPTGVTLEAASPTKYKATDTSVSVSKASKTGYTFNKWIVNTTGDVTYNATTGKLEISRADNVTLTPDMSANSVSVQYCDGIYENGQCIAPLEGVTNPTNTKYDDILTLPAAPNNSISNRFIYWMTNDGRFVSPGNTIRLTGDLVIYPYYVDFSKFHSITYNTNGGTFVNGDALTKFYEGDAFTLDASIVKGTSTFLGWYTEPEFTNQITSVVGQNTDLVLYAKWDDPASCNMVPEVRVLTEGGVKKVLVTFDMVNGFSQDHYVTEVVAYYPNSHVSDPRTFNYGDAVEPEFTYEEGMYITVNCNRNDHSEITILEDDFYVVPESDLEDCDLVTPDVRVFEATNRVLVTFDMVNGFDSDHYPVSVVAYYPNSHVSDPRLFSYGDAVAPEFDYEAGMYIEVKCNKDDHAEIVVPESEFYWMRTITLHYSGGGQTRTTTVEVGDELPIPEDTYLYTGGGGARYYSDYTWYIDSAHTIEYNNDGVTSSFDLYGVRN